MPAPVDALAGRLASLLANGRLNGGELSRSMRARIRPLFETGVLLETRVGSGTHVVVASREALERFVERAYPGGLDLIDDATLPPRARSVFMFRDAKRVGDRGPVPVLLRTLGTACLKRNEDMLDIAALTRVAGAAVVVVDEGCGWTFEGRVATVENFELFMHLERLGVEFDAALFSAGRLSLAVLSWLASPAMARATYLHFGDYDPVGLDEYMRLKAKCANRVHLHVPDDLDERLRLFGKRALLSDSAAVMDRMRRISDTDVAAVVSAIDRHGCGLEQEALLIPK